MEPMLETPKGKEGSAQQDMVQQALDSASTSAQGPDESMSSAQGQSAELAWFDKVGQATGKQKPAEGESKPQEAQKTPEAGPEAELAQSTDAGQPDAPEGESPDAPDEGENQSKAPDEGENQSKLPEAENQSKGPEAENQAADGGMTLAEGATGQGSAPNASMAPAKAPEQGQAPTGQTNKVASAVSAAAGFAWGITTDAFGPLVGYDRNRGGFGVGNFLGIGKSIEGIGKAASKDRGDGFLAGAIKVLDVVRAAAEGIGSVAGAIGTFCTVASLVGLFPPLAPVGAFLLSVAGIASNVGLIAGVVAFASSLLVSILSAIQVVQAASSGSAELKERYAQFKGDVGGLVSNGVAFAFDKITGKHADFAKKAKASGGGLKGAAKAMVQQGAEGKAMKVMGAALKVKDGRTARGVIQEGLVTLKVPNAKTILSQKGSTRAALQDTLQVNLRKAVLKKATDNVGKRFLKQASKSSGKGVFELASSAMNSKDAAPGAGPVKADQAMGPAQGASGAPARDFAAELAEVEAARQAALASKEHVSAQKIEAESAVEGGQSLAEQATEHEKAASTVDEKQGPAKETIAAQKQDALTGKAEAQKGIAESQKASGPGKDAQAQAESAKGKGDGLKVPEPKEEGLWDKVKNFFKKQVFGKVSAALQGVQNLMSKLILKVVASVAGVDDIEQKLKDAGVEMDDSAARSDETAQEATAVDQQSQEAHAQAQAAQSDAQTVIGKGQQDAAAAANQEQVLDGHLQSLDAEQASLEQAMAEQGAKEEGQPQQGQPEVELVSSSKLAALEKAAAEAASLIDENEDHAYRAAAEARLSMGASGSQHYLPLEGKLAGLQGRQDQRRGQLGALSAELASLSGKPKDQAEPQLDRIANEIVRIAAQAESEGDAFSMEVADAVSLAEESAQPATH